MRQNQHLKIIVIYKMTIINGIEIDHIVYIQNEIKSAIQNNDPIEPYLHVITVISNPCQFAQRYILARAFIKRMEHEPNTKLYVVELAHRDQKFYVTDSKNPRHLQICTNTAPLWHKENLINIGIKRLLPENWKAVAWIDADIEFENPDWALDSLKILNGTRDIIQLFSHCIDMDINEDAMNIFASFGFQYTKKRVYSKTGVLKMWHPGYAWACTRKLYDRMGGLYDLSILGAGDHNMALSLIDRGNISLNEHVHPDYLDSILEFQSKLNNARLGYTPGVIRHNFHGSKKNRRYAERWEILVKHAYSPRLHVTKNDIGLLVPTEACPQELLDDILFYFKQRSEDEGVLQRMRELNLN